MSLTPIRNDMGLMVRYSEHITDRREANPALVRYIFDPGKFAPILAGISDNSRRQKHDVYFEEYIDGQVTTFMLKHVHYFRDGIMTVFSGFGKSLFYGHGFKHVMHPNKMFEMMRTNECILRVIKVESFTCPMHNACLNHSLLILERTLNLRRLMEDSVVPASDAYKSNSVEENTFAFLNPQPNCAFEVDYTVRELKWVLKSKEYLEVCVKRKAENGLHFLSMALHAQEAKESETP